MVTVTPDKTVRISGGLSMEAVKRVIDQHLVISPTAMKPS
jgi:hypothetical protein